MIEHIEGLLAAGSALLAAEEQLMAELPEHAARTFAQADEVFTAARGAIYAALAAPGDPWQRLSLLRAAIEADGVDSLLVAQAAAALAEAAAVGANVRVAA